MKKILYTQPMNSRLISLKKYYLQKNFNLFHALWQIVYIQRFIKTIALIAIITISWEANANIVIIGNMPLSYKTSIAENICLLWNSTYKNNLCTVQPTENALQQIKYLNTSTNVFAVIGSDWATSSYKGLDVFQPLGKNKKIQWIATLGNSSFFIFTNKSVKSIAKLKGAHVLFSNGDTYSQFLGQILNTKDHLQWSFHTNSYDELMNKLCTKKELTVFISFVPPHSEKLKALIKNCHLFIVQDKKEWKTIANKLPGYILVTLPKNNWLYPQKHIYTLQIKNFLISKSTVNKQIKQNMQNLIKKHILQLQAIMPGVKNPKKGLTYKLKLPTFSS